MKIEDVTIDHIRRGAVVRIAQESGEFVGIPVGYRDFEHIVYKGNATRWHDKETCTGLKTLYSSYPKYTVHDCEGDCLPSQKILPWAKDRYIKMFHSHVYVKTQKKRVITFADGTTMEYVLDEWKEPLECRILK